MEITDFNRILLKTAFSCVACDGHIDKREVNLLRKLGNQEKLFGNIQLNDELDALVEKINAAGKTFLQEYLLELKHTNLSEEEELTLIRTAIRTINADEKLEYSEIKFFKIIRSKLQISTEKVLAFMPELEDFLEQDIITDSYIDRLKEHFFDQFELPQFEMVHRLDEDELV